jgi:hypothetical protein
MPNGEWLRVHHTPEMEMWAVPPFTIYKVGREGAVIERVAMCNDEFDVRFVLINRADPTAMMYGGNA